MSRPDDLPDFVTPIRSGMEDAEEVAIELPPDIVRKLSERLGEIARARAEAMRHAHEVVVWR